MCEMIFHLKVILSRTLFFRNEFMRGESTKKFFFLSLFLFLSLSSIKANSVDVRLETEEADAVLSILDKKKNNRQITDADWQQLFSSEGYVRLKKREAAMNRSFEDSAFKNFILSEELAKRFETLSETLAKWKRADTNGAARKALIYLPGDAHIKAKIYPVIKPRENSFVFETNTDSPAIFLYLDPDVSKEQFENTLAHELHHIGYASSCPAQKTKNEIEKLSENKQQLRTWLSAFGEGFAMLAAAGGTDIHPHAVSPASDKERWDKDVANFNDDLKRIEKFYLDILEKRLVTKDEIQKTGFAFFGEQGAWYTVGWKMSVLIEKTFSRNKLIEYFCDQRKLLAAYNSAAKKYNAKSHDKLSLWSETLIKAFD